MTRRRGRGSSPEPAGWKPRKPKRSRSTFGGWAISSDPRRREGRVRALISAALPPGAASDERTILAGTGQNLLGLVVYVAATLGTNVLIARALDAEALGRVTLATQIAFVAAAATRFGMDMAAVRRVAIQVGKDDPGPIRAIVSRAAAIAAAVSVLVALAVFAASGPLAKGLSAGAADAGIFRATALALPFAALCQVYLGGTRGLKIMRHTLYVYWAGQPVAWIALMLAGWIAVRSSTAAVVAYAASWALATAAAWFVWERESARFPRRPADPDEVLRLLRYGAPRAPAALLSQLLFWTDYFVLARYATPDELGVYAAAVRVAQALMLFLVAVNYMFSPFVADLHERGERERLDSLYKALTRWMVAGTLPLVVLLAVAPAAVLHVFGGEFGGGSTALRILLIGQLVNVGVGSVGFILIMVGRTGADLAVYALSFLLDLAVALVLAPALGAEGAAVAQTVTMAFSNAARLYLVWRFVHIQPFSRRYFRLLVPAAASALAMIPAHLVLVGTAWPLDLLGTAIVGVAGYAVVAYVVALTASERAAVRSILGRA